MKRKKIWMKKLFKYIESYKKSSNGNTTKNNNLGIGVYQIRNEERTYSTGGEKK